jgi:hypothetical protein
VPVEARRSDSEGAGRRRWSRGTTRVCVWRRQEGEGDRAESRGRVREDGDAGRKGEVGGEERMRGEAAAERGREGGRERGARAASSGVITSASSSLQAESPRALAASRARGDGGADAEPGPASGMSDPACTGKTNDLLYACSSLSSLSDAPFASASTVGSGSVLSNTELTADSEPSDPDA